MSSNESLFCLKNKINQKQSIAEELFNQKSSRVVCVFSQYYY